MGKTNEEIYVFAGNIEAGALGIAIMNELERQKVDTSKVIIIGNYPLKIAVKMAIIQLSLLGYQAVIKLSDSIWDDSEEVYSIPAYRLFHQKTA